MWSYVVSPILMSIAFYVMVNIIQSENNSDNIAQLQKERSFERNQVKQFGNQFVQQNVNDLDDQITQNNLFEDLYQGNWYSKSNFTGDQFNFFNGDNGIVLFGLSYSGLNYTEIDFLLFDPRYDDEKKIYLELENLNNCLITNQTWSCTTYMVAKSYYKRVLQKNDQIQVHFFMNVTKKDEKQPISSENSIFNVAIKSEPSQSLQVDLKAKLTVQDNNLTLYFILYNLFISVFGLQQLYSVIALTNYIMNTNEIISTKFSMLTVGFITIYDSYVSLAHLYMALEYTDYFYYFILPTIIYFVMTTIIDMKLLIIIWKNRCYVNYTTPSEVRKGFALFYAKFYICLIGFFTLTYFFYLYNYYILSWPLFIVPQIIHNFMKGNNPQFLKNYTFGMILSRAIIPLYFRTCPQNIRNLAPSLSFSITWPSLFVFFVLILFLQYKIGPRFFVPRRFKGGYDYYKYYQSNDAIMEEDCPICMSKLNEDPEDETPQYDQRIGSTSQEGGSQSVDTERFFQQNMVVKEALVKKKKIIQTSCNHKYHISCFKSWINVKLECPSCRNTLKPLID